MSEQTMNMADDRHPLTAALLSVIPGLGQLYNGERRKGVLFLDVSVLNFLLLWVILFTEPMVKSLQSFGSTFHVQPNESVVMALQHAHLGSPASVMILAMMVAFAVFAARDAYDRAFLKRRAIYPSTVVELSEATSGSYIIHISLMVAFGVLALFFLAPPPPQIDVHVIEFVQPLEEEPKPVKKTDLRSTVNMRDHGRHDANRPVNHSSPDDQPQRQSATDADRQQSESAKPVENSTWQQSQAIQPQPTLPQVKPREMPAPNMSVPAPMTRPIDLKPSQPVLMAPKLPNPMLSSMPIPLQSKPAMATPTNLAPSSNLSQSNLVTPVIASAAGILFGAANPHASGAVITGKGPVPALPAPRSIAGGGFVANAAAPMNIASSSASKGIGHAPDVVAVSSFGQKDGDGGYGDGSGSSGAPKPTRASTGGNGVADSVKVLPRGRDSIVPNDGLGTGTGNTANPSKDTDDKTGSDDTNAMPDFGKYMADLQRRIKKHWFPPRGPSSKRVVVIFTVHRDGTMTDLQRDSNSGDAIDLQAAMTAVQNAAPLPPLPAHSPSSVDIQFTFDYNVLVDGAPRRF
jgi:TonB family protein